MKRCLFIAFYLYCHLSFSQQYWIFKNSIYTSYVNPTYNQPVLVIYKLYQGGGNMSRSNMRFKDTLEFKSKYYSKSGYQRGHLCPAEDFAFNEELERKTFMLYNVIPQTPSLNLGPWKRLENVVRNYSKKDSLIILTGGYDFTKELDLWIPKKCYKIIYNINTKKIYTWVCNNSMKVENINCHTVSIDTILTKLPIIHNQLNNLNIKYK